MRRPMNYPSRSDKTHPQHNKHSFNFYRAEDRILPFSVLYNSRTGSTLTTEVGAEFQNIGFLPAEVTGQPGFLTDDLQVQLTTS